MVYDRKKIQQQSYPSLLKERGTSACFYAAFLIGTFYAMNVFVFKIQPHIPTYIFLYGFFFLYETFKPKLIIKLREVLNVKDPFL
jgi:hypothetical protein